MKLTEAIEIPLYESFSDLTRIVKETHNMVFGGGVYRGNTFNIRTDNPEVASYIDEYYESILDVVDQLSQNARNPENIPSKRDITAPSGLAFFLNYLIKHPYVQNDSHMKDVGWWIRKIKSNKTPEEGFLELLDMIFSVTQEIIKFESDPNRRKPDMDIVRKTPDFEVYRLNNYAAARKVCTTFKTNFCIGANPAMFDMYASEAMRDTYAITLPNRTVVIVHYRKGKGYLVTSHDNNSEFSDTNLRGSRGRGIMGVLDDFTEAGLTLDDMEYSMATFMTRAESNEIAAAADKIKRTGVMSDKISNPFGEFEDDPFAEWDADDIMNMFNNPPDA